MKRLLMLVGIMLICSCSSHDDQSIPDKDKLKLSLQMGATNKAQSIMMKRLKKDPENIDLNFGLADIYYQQGKYDLQKSILSSMHIDESKDTDNFIKLNMELMRNDLKLSDFSSVTTHFNVLNNLNKNKELTHQQYGKVLTYLAIAYCKKNLFDQCIELLGTAGKYLPGDLSVSDNLSIAQYMRSNANASGDISLLYRGYNDSHSDTMLSNLVMALISQGDEGQAFKLLTRRYPQAEALTVIDELKAIHNVKNI
jgi:Flp pilus assembly protein TadD